MSINIKSWVWDPAEYELLEDINYETDKHEANYISPDGMLEISVGEWLIKKGFKWNGTTAVPDGPNHPNPNEVPVMALTKHPVPITWKASLVHDIGSTHVYEKDFPYTRKEVDQIFEQLLKDINFKHTELYYIGVRLFSLTLAKWFWKFGKKI